MNDGPSVLLRCDGSPEIGLGHVVRCLALADELRDAHKCRIAFAMREGPLGFGMVQEKGYPVLTAPDAKQPFSYPEWMTRGITKLGARALILDVRDDLARSDVEKLRERGIIVAVLDDLSERRLAADLAFYPPVPQVHELDWAGFTGQLYVGWEWVVLRRDFTRRLQRVPHERPVVLVTMGGSDPAGLTLKVVAALDLLDEDFETVVVLGPGYCHHDSLRKVLARSRRQYDVREGVTDMASVMAQVDLAVASFGVTAYELAAMGVPAVYLCLTQDHAQSALVFENAGMAVCLGVFTQVTVEEVSKAVRDLLSGNSKREEMAYQAHRRVDGWGAERAALKVKERTATSNA